VSILSKFYKQFSGTKVFYKAFICLEFAFVIFWQKEISTKDAHIIFVKFNHYFMSTFFTWKGYAQLFVLTDWVYFLAKEIGTIRCS